MRVRGKGFRLLQISVNCPKKCSSVKAYAEGKVPISRVTRKLLDKHDINLTVREAKERLRWIGACEYHHTSKYAQRTDFYDLSELKAELESEKIKIGETETETPDTDLK